MNCASNVYNCPENIDELNNSLYLKGLGLTDIIIKPHIELEMSKQKNQEMQREYLLKESFNRPIIALTDGLYVMVNQQSTRLYGKSYRIMNR